MLLSKCEVCDSKKSKFDRRKEASRFVNSWGTKKPFNKILWVDSIFLKSIKQVNTGCDLNKIVNNFLLSGEEFMPEMHLRHQGFTYSACGPFKKSKGRTQELKGTGDS